jgi:Transmembrane secretion effector
VPASYARSIFPRHRSGPHSLRGGTRPHHPLAASLIAGLAWITALVTINVSAQMALPPWVRGRGLSIYVAVMFGAMSLGSAVAAKPIWRKHKTEPHRYLSL